MWLRWELDKCRQIGYTTEEGNYDTYKTTKGGKSQSKLKRTIDKWEYLTQHTINLIFPYVWMIKCISFPFLVPSRRGRNGTLCSHYCMHKWLLYLVYHGLCLLGLCVYEIEKRTRFYPLRCFNGHFHEPSCEWWKLSIQKPTTCRFLWCQLVLPFLSATVELPRPFSPTMAFVVACFPSFRLSSHPQHIKKVREKKGDSSATRSLAAQNDETKNWTYGLWPISSIFSFHTFTAVFILFLAFYLFPTDVYSTS